MIALITEWTKADGTREIRTEESDLGGMMRLGVEECRPTPGSAVAEIYGADVVSERHRHRWEFNNDRLGQLSEAGLQIAGVRWMELVEVVEVDDHPWFVGCQFHRNLRHTTMGIHCLRVSLKPQSLTQVRTRIPCSREISDQYRRHAVFQYTPDDAVRRHECLGVGGARLRDS